jgi:hypothetical protein
VLKSGGKRKGYQVFGLMDDFTGQFVYQGQEGRLPSATDIAFLTRVLEQTPQPSLLIQDGAQYHTSPETNAFFAQQTARLEVFQLPSYSPDDNPIDKLWKNVQKEGTPLQSFPPLAALTAKVEHALLKFANTPEEILSLGHLPTAWVTAA